MPHRTPAHQWLFRAAWAALLLAGCNDPPGIAQVSGIVLLDGQPLADAVITFQPVRESAASQPVSGSVGRTDEKGQFTLRLIEPDAPGAAVGKHVVTITTAKSGPSDAIPPRGERVPRAWRNGSQTLDVTPEGTKTARIEMHSP